jgi:hypothetical protein
LAYPFGSGLIRLSPDLYERQAHRAARRPGHPVTLLHAPVSRLPASRVNRVLEVDLDGDDVAFALYDLPSGAT